MRSTLSSITLHFLHLELETAPYKGLHIIEKNCPGVEKLNRIKGAFPEHHLAVAFSDNEDDMELLHQADLGYWVLSDGNIWPF